MLWLLRRPLLLLTVRLCAAGVVGDAPSGHVRLNGILYKLPQDFPEAVAKEVVMIEVNTKNLSSVFVPQFRLEAFYGIKPKLYSQFQNMTLKAGWSVAGDAEFELNKYSLEDSKTL